MRRSSINRVECTLISENRLASAESLKTPAMSSKKRFMVVLILGLTAPLFVNAYAYLPAQAPLTIPKRIEGRLDPTSTMFRPHSGMQGLALNG
jgi:hypothetical protein